MASPGSPVTAARTVRRRAVERVDQAEVGELGHERGDGAAQGLLEVERLRQRARRALEHAGVVLVALTRRAPR